MSEGAPRTDGAGPPADVTDRTDDTVEEPGADASAASGEAGAESGADDGDDAGDAGEAAPRVEGPSISALEREGDIAADYLEELLDIADLDGDLDLDVEGDRAAVSVVGEGLDGLIGRHGEVVEALQELTRLAVLRETGERSRLMLDIGGYRAGKRKALEQQAREVVAEVRESGEAQKLAPMTPFERKVVHDAVAAAGLTTQSEGEEPNRCVVVLPA